MRTFSSLPPRTARPCTHVRGFTLLDLLAVMAALTFLSLVMMKGLAGARDGSQTVQCLNNHRQLIAAWHMYAEENAGKLVMSFHGSSAAGGTAGYDPRVAPWVLGWLDWTTSSDNTNLHFTTGERYSRLAKYFSRDPRVFQCPADTYVSATQAALGWTRRARSYAMSAAWGDGNATTGPWDGLYRQVKKLQELTQPVPGRAFVFIEEHPDDINDPMMHLPYATKLIDAPANHHNGACAVSFADGHAEVHDWEGAALDGRSSRVIHTDYVIPQLPPGDPDIHWLSWHSPRINKNSY